MIISGIQSNTVRQDIVSLNSNNGHSSASVKPALPEEAGIDHSQSGKAQLQGVVARIDYMKQELDQILVDYPPFFPAGSPQRIDWIDKIKKTQEDAETGGAGNTGTGVKIQKLTNGATDGEISAAIEGLTKFRNDTGKNAQLTPAPGTLLTIKV